MRCLILSFVAVAALSTVAQAAPRFYVRAFKPGDTKEPSVIVKPLDDPGNPYRGQYSAYDQWCVEHYNHNITADNNFNWQLGLAQAQGVHPGGSGIGEPQADVTKGLRMTFTLVDENGYIVPHGWRDPDAVPDTTTYTLSHFIERGHHRGQLKQTGVWSLGYMTPDLFADEGNRHEIETAKWYPAVKDWMVALNRKTVLLPDGGAIFISDSRFAPNGVTGQWYIQRFGPDGAMMKDTLVLSEHSWHKVLSDLQRHDERYFRKLEYTRATGEKASYNNSHGVNGRYVVFDAEDREGVLAVVDFWENKVWTPETDGPDFLDKLPIEGGYFIPIDAQQLARIYLAQQNQL